MLPTLRRSSAGSVFDSPLDLVQQEFNRALNRWVTDGGEADLMGVYPVDIREDDAHIYVDAELPGFTKDQVNVTLENGLLHITAERKAEKAKGETHLMERRYTRVSRSFTLPNAVHEGSAECKLDNGVLHLMLNKREEVRPRKIEIK